MLAVRENIKRTRWYQEPGNPQKSKVLDKWTKSKCRAGEQGCCSRGTVMWRVKADSDSGGIDCLWIWFASMFFANRIIIRCRNWEFEVMGDDLSIFGTNNPPHWRFSIRNRDSTQSQQIVKTATSKCHKLPVEQLNDRYTTRSHWSLLQFWICRSQQIS